MVNFRDIGAAIKNLPNLGTPMSNDHLYSGSLLTCPINPIIPVCLLLMVFCNLTRA